MTETTQSPHANGSDGAIKGQGWKKERARINREIYDLLKAGIDPDEIAIEYKIGRQDVFNKASSIERQIACKELRKEKAFERLGPGECRALYEIGIRCLADCAGLTREKFLAGEGNGPGGWQEVEPWLKFYDQAIKKAEMKAQIQKVREGNAPTLPLQPPEPKPALVLGPVVRKEDPPAVQKINGMLNKAEKAPATGDGLVCCPRCKFRWDPTS